MSGTGPSAGSVTDPDRDNRVPFARLGTGTPALTIGAVQRKLGGPVAAGYGKRWWTVSGSDVRARGVFASGGCTQRTRRGPLPSTCRRHNPI